MCIRDSPQTASKYAPPASAKSAAAPAPAPAPSPAPSTPLHKSYQSLEPNEQTFITKDTIIEGSIITKSDIKISGCMKGNLTSDHDIYINGQVDGDVKGNAVTLNNGVVKGNISSETFINLNEKAIDVYKRQDQQIHSLLLEQDGESGVPAPIGVEKGGGEELSILYLSDSEQLAFSEMLEHLVVFGGDCYSHVISSSLQSDRRFYRGNRPRTAR